MNCLEFRRAIGTDPRGLDSAAHAHRNQCRRCGEAHERALDFERTLMLAAAIPTPDNLAERILLHQTTAALHEPRMPRVPLWAIAATCVIGIALAATAGWRTFLANAATTDLAVEHLAHEPFALLARAEVADSDVRALFAALGTPITHSPGAVHYLKRCPLGGRMSAHMVMQRESGPVTAMYLPKLHEARRDFERTGVRGREAPMGDGTLILLAADAREFDAIESQFQLAFSGHNSMAVGAP